MEMRDIYDENKNRTGRTVAAGAPLGRGERILCVGCWIVNRKGEIFITKRSHEKRFMPDKWENQGGHAVAGEDGPQAVIREMFEETGIRAERSDLILLAEKTHEEFFSEDYAVVKDFPLNDVILQEGETCDAAWVSEERWEEMMSTEEIAPSVRDNLASHKAKLLDILHELKDCRDRT